MKILAVDDDPLILKLISMMAAKIGYPEVVTALTGEEALAALVDASRPFECLLLDLSMPGKGGIDLCTRVRSIPGYRKVPIIMLTTMHEKALIERAYQAGATDYATKPLDSVELCARIRVAESIIIAQREAANAAKLRDPASKRDHVFELSDEISVDGTENLVDYPTLKNHLVQLSRAGALGSQVVAIKIDQIDKIFARASSYEFLYVLSETADAIAEAFKPFGYLMAYAGNGIFVVVSNKVSFEPSISIESEVQYILDEKTMEYDNGDQLEIEVSVGNPIRPTVSKVRRVAKTFDRAIARAENRATRKQLEPRPPSIRFVG